MSETKTDPKYVVVDVRERHLTEEDLNYFADKGYEFLTTTQAGSETHYIVMRRSS